MDGAAVSCQTLIRGGLGKRLRANRKARVPINTGLGLLSLRLRDLVKQIEDSRVRLKR